MKVFLSWSGDLSHEVALVLREWLPSVIQAVEPYVSSEDIDKGVRWSTDIAKELEGSSFGILCLTKENLEAPWIHFEAGALSKTVEKAYVCPFLFGLERSEIKGPLLQFQSTVYEKSDIEKLLRSLNAACKVGGLEETRLSNVFEVWWPKLTEKLDAVAKKEPEVMPRGSGIGEHPNQRQMQAAILEEILDIVRNQQKLLRSPEEFIPPQYLAGVLREVTLLGGDPRLTGFLDQAYMMLRDLDAQASQTEKDLPRDKLKQTLGEAVAIMAHVVHMTGRYRRR